MPADLRPPPDYGQLWPCGPECRYARPLAGSYGEWHWCTHPQCGGRLVHEGHECRNFSAPASAAELTGSAARQN